MKEEIISITEKVVPTVLSYDVKKEEPCIGSFAKDLCLQGYTNIYNFKMNLGLSDTEFSKIKKYWYAIAEDKKIIHSETFSLKEVTTIFIQKLLQFEHLPRQIIIGEPAIREERWRENFRAHIKEVFAEIGIELAPKFISEPFAVFQYYRNHEKFFSQENKSENILIIDIGAGTFNSSIIKTTNEGALARGGATSLPLGLRADVSGGSLIDKELLEIVVKKAREKGYIWKEDPIERSLHNKIPVLLYVEKAKIAISNKFPLKAKLNEEFSNISELIRIPSGSLHPEREVEVILTGNDLKEVIRKTWRNHWGKVLIETINEARDKLEGKLAKIDKVLVAGGSSELPFMEEEISTVLPTLVEKDSICLGKDPGNAVAYGIAYECKEQSRRDSNLSVGKLAPCLLNDIYFCVKKERRSEEFFFPKIKINSKSIQNGHIVSSPFEIEDIEIVLDCEFPFDVKEKFYYYFSLEPPGEKFDFIPLNLNDDVISLESFNKVSKRFQMKVEISKSGKLIPTFYFKEKGASSRKSPREVVCNEVFIDNIEIHEGESYLGIDFGTANSYVCRFLSSKEEISPFHYPNFDVNKRIFEQLREFETEIKNKNELFGRELILEHAITQKLHIIFHSNKIEGNPLSKGETEKIFQTNKEDITSKKELEAKNLENAFHWVLDNLDVCLQDPEAFICKINQIILEGIDSSAGQYRRGPVKISGVDFSPPPAASVKPFMSEFADELRRGIENRSLLEFACSAHTKLVFIHPFSDGNGRTARLFMNAILWKNGLPGIIINYYDKGRYLDALMQSNRGDLSSLVEIFLEAIRPEIDSIQELRRSNESLNIVGTIKRDDSQEIIDISPLISIAKKIKTKNEEVLEERYLLWRNAFLEFFETFKSVVEQTNESREFIESSISVKLFPYDILDFEKYCNIVNQKKVSRTWFFAFQINVGFSKEKFLLFFQNASYEIEHLKKVHKASLALTRYDGDGYKRLKNEPIKIRELFVIENRIYGLDYNKEIVKDEPDKLILSIIGNILEEYFC